MNAKTTTAPGKVFIFKVETAIPAGAKLTQRTGMMEFEKVKHLLSDKPLRPPVRPEGR